MNTLRNHLNTPRFDRLLFVLLACFGLLFTASSVQASATYDSTAVKSAVREPEDVEGTKNPNADSLAERIEQEGAQRMGGDEARAHLAGKTQQWSNGGAYYHPDGRLDFIWEGKGFNDYSWKASGSGLVCISNPSGFNTSCSQYFRHKNEVWTVVTEVFGEEQQFFGGPDTILDGNQLGNLQPWDPALSGN